MTAKHDASNPPDAMSAASAAPADRQLHDPDPEELLLDELAPQDSGAPLSGKRKTLALVMRVVGIGLAVAAVTLCVIALVDAWPTVSEAISHADAGWLVVAMVASVLSMTGLAVLWHQVLLAFDRRWPLGKVTAWYFAGELGKYLPGGIWPVVGRGELARRGGVARSTAYATTLLSLALMCVGAAIACGLLAPFLALNGGGIGLAWLLLLLIPLGVVFAHPVVSRPFFGALAKLTKGRVDLTPPSFGRMLSLLVTGTPTWLLVGAASCAITEALGYDQQPARVAFAAIVAWIVGFLAVPVPAGAGIRELIFVALCGLDAGPAVAVAAIARLMLMLTDGVGGVAGLLAARRAGDARTRTAVGNDVAARMDATARNDPADGDSAAGAPDGVGNTA
jgi:uncharacterized membrane protein YbhN (UPF0104 family)